jgi:hypothetical protein
MSPLDPNCYRFGDKTRVRFGYDWVPARVISRLDISARQALTWSTRPTDFRPLQSGATYSHCVKVALSLPQSFKYGSSRTAPAGTPVFWAFEPADIELEAHDPDWQAYDIKPFLSPDQYLVITGLPKTTRAEAVSHVAAYADTPTYAKGDPVWAWDDGWHPAVVVNVSQRWISVRYRDNVRNHKGQNAKSYRSRSIWPVLCDLPEPMTHLTISETMLRGRHLACEESEHCLRPGESGCGSALDLPRAHQLPTWLRIAHPPPSASISLAGNGSGAT